MSWAVLHRGDLDVSLLQATPFRQPPILKRPVCTQRCRYSSTPIPVAKSKTTQRGRCGRVMNGNSTLPFSPASIRVVCPSPTNTNTERHYVRWLISVVRRIKLMVYGMADALDRANLFSTASKAPSTLGLTVRGLMDGGSIHGARAKSVLRSEDVVFA